MPDDAPHAVSDSTTEGLPAVASARTTALCCSVVVAAFVCSGVAAAISGWRPSWDTAFIQMRVLDVGGRHTPLVGMPSTVSDALSTTASHPGPLHFWLLAIPNALLRWAQAGLAIAQSLINAALAVISVLAVRTARVHDRRVGTQAVCLATLTWLLIALLVGDEVLHDPWNPHMATIALLAATISAIAVLLNGTRVALVSLILSASVAAQAHLSALIPALALVLATLLLAMQRRGWRRVRTEAITVGVTFVACWSGPVLDQLIHRPGNLRTLLTAGDSLGKPFGFVTGFDRLARAVTPPGLIRSGLPAVMTGGGLWIGRVVLLLFVGVAVLIVVSTRKRAAAGDRLPAATVATVALVLAAATWLGQSITPVTFGSVFGRHMWELMWPAAIALWVAAGVALNELLRRPSTATLQPLIRLAAAPLLVPAACVFMLAVLALRSATTDISTQRDGRWFPAIASAANAVSTGTVEIAGITVVTNGLAIESELVAGVGADLARRGVDVAFDGPVSAGLLHPYRLRAAAPASWLLFFTTFADDPLAAGSLPVSVIQSPVDPGVTIHVFLIEAQT